MGHCCMLRDLTSAWLPRCSAAEHGEQGRKRFVLLLRAMRQPLQRDISRCSIGSLVQKPVSDVQCFVEVPSSAEALASTTL